MHRSGPHPDRYTLPLALKASSHLYSPSLASQLHCLSVKHGLDRSEYTESGVISSYAKLGLFESARRVFDENAERKVGSWNAMINGYSNGGEGVEVVRLFVEMRRRGVVEDEMTMIGVVSACGGLGDFRLAQQVHKCAIQVKSSDRLDITVSNSLIDMYCKCGRTDLAHRVFSRVSQRNVSTWTSIVTGFATYGQEKLALDFFNKMIEEKIHPNHVTMVAVLNACTHGGLIKEGIHFLENMKELYNIEPNALHYGCVVDMLGRVGRLKEARKVVERMPMGANVVIWGTLLGASEKYGDVKVGEWAAKNLMELEPWNDGVYVVLSNIYAKVGMWEKVERLRKEMRARRVEKVPGYSLATRDL
ncbi:uncharacterized protein A4U43_C05F26320 [Asparagus officinalis]|uniref:Pentatricopeptide repeat-containing protein n=2 Tax=Asparagus officinalis TaxID=4686 RepID=A0A5P1EYY7_ASPOF|nr:uncharacterized protein A4U43_C05F26320 [Asparagus officinalis]